MNSFNNLGVRYNAKKYSLVYSSLQFVAIVDYPKKTSSHQEIVEDYIEDILNLNGFRSYTDGPKQIVIGLFCYAKCFDRQKKLAIVARNALN